MKYFNLVVLIYFACLFTYLGYRSNKNRQEFIKIKALVEKVIEIRSNGLPICSNVANRLSIDCVYWNEGNPDPRNNGWLKSKTKNCDALPKVQVFDDKKYTINYMRNKWGNCDVLYNEE